MNLAAPTPPASVVIEGLEGGSNRPRAIGSLPAVELLVERAALDRDASGGARMVFDQVDRDKLAGRAAGLRGDALFHQGAREIVASGLQRDRRQLDAELDPRGLQVVDLPAQEQPRER